MRRKQQIQAMQQELALLRQTIDSGKELAALANSAAQQLKKPSIRTIAVQVMKTPRRAQRGRSRRRRHGRRHRRALPVLPDRRRAGSEKGAQACARPARRPAGDRGRHGRGRRHRAGKDPQGEKALPLRRGGRNTKKAPFPDRKRSFFVVIVLLGSTAGRGLRGADFRAWSARS